MKHKATEIASEIERYLRTGNTDPLSSAWPGAGVMERGMRARHELREALLREAHRLAAGRAHGPLPVTDTAALTRRMVEPMVRGLFPRAEADTVLAGVSKSVIFVTSHTIDEVLHRPGFDSTA